MRLFNHAIAISGFLLATSTFAQTASDNAVTVGRQLNWVKDNGSYQNRFNDMEEATIASKGGSYMTGLRDGMEMLVQNADQSWSMYSFTAGPSIKAQLDAINALDPVKDAKVRAKQETAIIKIINPQIANIDNPKLPGTKLNVRALALVNGSIIELGAGANLSGKVADPNAAKKVNSYRYTDEASGSFLEKEDFILAYQPCDTASPIAAFKSPSLAALIEKYKRDVPKRDDGFRYGSNGEVYLGSSDDKNAIPQLAPAAQAKIDAKMIDDVLVQSPKLFSDGGSCAVKPFELRVAERRPVALERDVTGSPLIGTKFSDGIIASAMNQHVGKAVANGFALSDMRGAALAAATIQFPEIKILVSDGKAIYIYRPSVDLKNSSKSLQEIAAMLKTTPVNNGLTVVAVMNGFKNEAKGEMVNPLPSEQK
jgi:hypothetical protein